LLTQRAPKKYLRNLATSALKSDRINVMILGIILAAGESQRIGSPKALLKIGGETFANRIAGIMRDVGIHNILLVAGLHRDEIANDSKEYHVLFNPDYSLGQFSSLQRGVRNLPTGTRQVLVWPVDMPLVRKDTVEKLIAGSLQQPLILPTFSGKKGHPVIYNSQALLRILTMKPSQTGKELVAHFEGRLAQIEVDDPGILIDIDTPEDYQKYIKRGDLSPSN
jgi:CTP:molybdopterin cytidylyltransferase MocA